MWGELRLIKITVVVTAAKAPLVHEADSCTHDLRPFPACSQAPELSAATLTVGLALQVALTNAISAHGTEVRA